MRNRRDKEQELFSFVEIDRFVPADHLLRKIGRRVNFSVIQKLVDPVYSDVTGRPAWDLNVYFGMRSSAFYMV